MPTVAELAARFRRPLLREALLTLFEPDFSVFYMVLSQMGFLYRQEAAYPLGGSLPLALALEKRLPRSSAGTCSTGPAWSRSRSKTACACGRPFRGRQ